jgi:hypothetical protein
MGVRPRATADGSGGISSYVGISSNRKLAVSDCRTREAQNARGEEKLRRLSSTASARRRVGIPMSQGVEFWCSSEWGEQLSLVDYQAS